MNRGHTEKTLTEEASWAHSMHSQSDGTAMICLARHTSQMASSVSSASRLAAAERTGDGLREFGGHTDGLLDGLLDHVVERGMRPPRRSSTASSRAMPGAGIHGESGVSHLVEKSMVTLVRVEMGPPRVSQRISWSISVL